MSGIDHRADPPSRPLVAAKHRIPPTRAWTLPRERLLEHLRASTTRLTTLVAPAGWGKTTLLAAWAREPDPGRLTAWLSVDESDDEPAHFWTCVVRALQMVAPTLGDSTLRALRTPGSHPIDIAMPTLLNELEDLGATLVLVIDDYHLIGDKRIHESVEFLLGYLPPNLRLVISTRSDPPLPVAKLRARDELTEIRADDLRFTDVETASFVAEIAEVELDGEVVDSLVARTEGWAAGLQLAAIAIRHSPDPAARAAEMRGDDRHVMDYFADEVLGRLTTPQRHLLVRTSVLERLSGSLCDAVLETTGSAAVLDGLDRANLFIVPMDEHRTWFRCHRLFRDALRHELETLAPSDIPALLHRAADWFVAHGDPESAIRLLLAGDDVPGAIALLPDSLPWFVERGAVASYLQLGDRLPSAEVLAEPRLCISLAWAASMCGHPQRVRPWLDAAEPLITNGDRPLDGWHTLRAAAATLRATSGYELHADVESALAHAELAAALETDPSVRGYVVARVALGAVLLGDGRCEDAVAVVEDAWSMPITRRLPPLLRLQTAGVLAAGWLRSGRSEDAQNLCDRVAPEALALEAAWGDNAAPALALLRSVEGRLAYLDGSIERSRVLLRRAAHLADLSGHGSLRVAVLTRLAEAEHAGGDPRAARAALATARHVAGDEPVVPQALAQLETAEARIGRVAAHAARQTGQIVEVLTDRELTVLRALQGPLTQREIGRELFLSLNTIKGYTKGLYRKLAVASREDAVARGRDLGLI